MTEITKEHLLTTGLRILDTKGRSSLKISQVCSELNLTKGSFYHWFKSKQEYDISLLTFWREVFTIQFIEDANIGESSQDKLNRLIQNCINSMRDESRLELEINIWATQDSEINDFVKDVYDQRFKYLVTLLEDIYNNKDEAKRHSLILYSLIIGSDLFYKKLSKKELRSIFQDYITS